jgi:hypothetical protein
MKTSKLGRTAQTIVLNKYEKKELCPVYTIKKYLERTKKIRKSNKVLISLRTRQKDSTSTLARWLKIVLKSSGIDSSVFKTHSFRICKSGVTLNDIMKTANWQSAKTFKKFYLRETEADSLNDNCNNVANKVSTIYQ